MRLLQDKAYEHQRTDGSFSFCFENSPMTDAWMVILLKSLGVKDDSFIASLTDRLLRLQHKEGYFELYKDEGRNLSATIEAYYALLLAQVVDQSDERMKRAEAFIVQHGGLEAASSLTKVMLAVTGQMEWPRVYHIPILFALLPPTAPLSFYDFGGYARVHMSPILILSDSRFKLIRRGSPTLTHLHKYRDTTSTQDMRERDFLQAVHEGLKTLVGIPNELVKRARRTLETYMLQRIEPDGTLYSYFSSTFLMIYALLALGYSKRDPIIIKAIQGLKGLRFETKLGIHIQNSPSTVWDTSLLTYALHQSGITQTSSSLVKAVSYIARQQHTRFGDWAKNNQAATPGGFGFSPTNTINPDIDDTTAALRAIQPHLTSSSPLRSAWDRGLRFVLTMQNSDGGWPAFEKDTYKSILTYTPLDGAEAAAIDPSTADLTGRTLHFLGKDANLTLLQPNIQKAVEWLISHQEKDGSWYGRWGICYTYGTWAALTGMKAVGVSHEDDSVQRGLEWLERIQLPDGGWGESCRSDVERSYIPLHHSTISHTCWALEVLLAWNNEMTPAIEKGIKRLIMLVHEPDAWYSYPTGAGLPGDFYIYYHSYNIIWPLLVLSEYRKKA
ncbi:squalene-hopene cyclase [Pontibacillus halophilus JSM 076056 = DSM 19796]|uniref:Squalene-hopene cyclase n=1 Tax=Pontibacillus halophilus JSM 076056 = DSM 19796 TaxID=1385510 RepID=A0A0A5IAX7_9BACI|nr:squalene-hopene cyclase [Pontibacillus halophilus JSM 076056 = DSM 19796]